VSPPGVETLVVGALPEEIRPLVRRLEARQSGPVGVVRGTLAGHAVAVAATGDGGEAAGAGLARLLEALAPKRVLGIGFAGGLDPVLPRGTVVVAEAVRAGPGRIEADAAWGRRTSDALGAPRGVLASAPLLVPDPDAKAALFEATGARTVDLETHAWAAAATAAGIPWLALRIVFDRASDTVPGFVQRAADAQGRMRRGRLVLAALAWPSRFGVLARLAGASRALAAHLADAAAVAVALKPGRADPPAPGP